MFTEIPAAEWRKLIPATLLFSNEAPWEWVQDTQVFGVIDPQTSQKIYCSVMGQSGEMRAVALYPGKEGWKSYLQLGSEDLDADPSELVYHQSCVVISFETPQNAERDDLALLQSVGISSDSMTLIPSFRSYRPGYLPQSPDLEEVKMMQLVVPQAFALLAELQGASVELPEEGLNENGEMLFRSQDAGENWRTEWVKPDPTVDFSPPVLTLDQTEIHRAAQLPQKEAIWLLDNFHLPHPAMNEAEVAFFPHAFVFFDLEVQEFRGIALLEPEDFPDLLCGMLVEMLDQQEIRPTQMVVSKRNNLILMRPFCQSLGITLHLQEDLDIRDALKEALLESMQAAE
jgi:hypothetical protein